MEKASAGIPKQILERVRAELSEEDVSNLLASDEEITKKIRQALAEEQEAKRQLGQGGFSDFVSEIVGEVIPKIKDSQDQFLAETKAEILEDIFSWHEKRSKETAQKRKAFISGVSGKIKKILGSWCDDVLSDVDEASIAEALAEGILRAKKGGVKKSGREAAEDSVPLQQIIAEWEAFYKRHFDMKVDLSKVQIPDMQGNFSRILILAKGLTPQRVLAAYEARFPLSFSGRDDIRNRRSSKSRSYAIRVRDSQESDKELNGYTEARLKEEKIEGIAVVEWLIYDMKFYEETGWHLDTKSKTICSGSKKYGDTFVASFRNKCADIARRSQSAGTPSARVRAVLACDSEKKGAKKKRQSAPSPFYTF